MKVRIGTLLVVVALSAHAAPSYSLQVNPAADGIAVGLGAATWLSSETLFKPTLSPSHCRWCDRAPDGSDALNAVDRFGLSLRGSNPIAFSRASDFLAFLILPTATLGTHAALAIRTHSANALAVDGLLVAEAVITTQLVTQVAKFSVGRERPFVHRLPEEEKALLAHPEDNNLSFFSGHTSLAFSLVAASATVAELRGYPGAPFIWAVGLPLAVGVGVLRMAADKHYLTDVVAGAAVGTAMGVALPRLFHGRKSDSSAAVGTVPAGISAGFLF